MPGAGLASLADCPTMRGVPINVTVKDAVPTWVGDAVRAVRNQALALRYRGNAVECPACERCFARFLPRPDRDGAICPGCHCFERHRMFWLLFRRHPELLSGRLR